MTIQKNIFQTCADESLLKPEIRRNIDKLKQLNPQWNHQLFDDKAMWAYFEQHFDATVMAILARVNPSYGVVLADLFRYLVVYNHGGVYLDSKSTVDRPLDDIIGPNDEMIISQWRNKLGEEFMGAGLYPELARIPGGEFQQWHVIAKQHHPLLLTVVNQVISNIQSYDRRWFGVGKEGVLRLSGPICYTQCIAPAMFTHKIRVVDIQSQGFVYSLYKALGDKDAHAKEPGHYSLLKEPIVLPA